ncbi:MAG: aminomethyl-transferring glycine dehydrogenase [Bacteroidetes bacterium]|nr:aminomethyl-transferring glycine dehydrogenase [Bacteroidota bacterium]
MNPKMFITDQFVNRHIGPDAHEKEKMLKTIGVDSLDQLIDQTIPSAIRLKSPLSGIKAQTETDFLANLRNVASKNIVNKSFIGMGYYDCITPTVILRNVLENPGWYTQYTPYQAEIAQGRLEALLNFQTMIIDLTGLPIANASLLDEATAATEAMHLFHATKPKESAEKHVFFVSENCFPQTIDLLKTRSEPLGIELIIGNHETIDWANVFGALVQYPDGNGEIFNYKNFCEEAHSNGAYVAVAADLMSLCLLKPPGEFGADVVLGSSQRFGVPMGYGGPHAAFFATKEDFKRQIPGRIIGVSVDSTGKPALRMALQTREQHIRRDKATSNICTAQVLLAVMASMYGVYHGPKGILTIAERIHALTMMLASAATTIGCKIENSTFFDTLKFSLPNAELVKPLAEASGLNFRYYDDECVGISLDETSTHSDVQAILYVLAPALAGKSQPNHTATTKGLPKDLIRTSEFMTHPVFNKHHSEHEMLRYMKSLENKDLSLVHSMIPLGSCTMKLNATSEMIPVTWKEFGGIHPFAPLSQTEGYQEIFKQLEKALCEITGFDAMSLQPNSGAQGEYAGLLAIREFHKANGDSHRNVALIPSSAHGTNPASAVMAGMKVVVTKCDELGNIDVKDLSEKAQLHKANLACLMVTYPSTHGVFEESIIEICNIIHENGGQVYMDGANMNAQVGLTSPRNIGADVCHLNLHKTFCIPHGGGGPGMGPIGVREHLAKFLPSHSVVDNGRSIASAVSAAPWGSSSILLISWAYIQMMGCDGLTEATRVAILNANYIKARLEKHFPILYQGTHGRVAHEMIVDMRKFKQSAGIEVGDIAKRLMDYGFHAPTVSFPVAGTLMIEPTESEPLEEIDRFCDALISIGEEIQEIESGNQSREDNVLKNAPHTVSVIADDEWNHAYSRSKAAFPLPWVRDKKFWPSVGRVNDTHGDRMLICACPPIEDYQ